MLVAFEEDGKQNIGGSSIAQPVFPVLRIGRMYAMAAFYMRDTHVYSILHAWYTRVHAWCDATCVVVLALCVRHAILCVCHASGTRVTRVDCLSCG